MKILILLLALALGACSSTPEQAKPRGESMSMSLAHKELFEIISEQNHLLENYKGEITDKLQLAQMNTKYKKLVSRWQNYISQYPNDKDAIIIYGKFLRAVGEFSLAYSAFLEVDKLDPNIAVVKQQLATFQGDYGMHKEAFENLNKAIELDAEVAIYYYQLAELLCVYYKDFENIYKNQELNELIESNFKKAIELDPKNSHLYWRYAQSFYEQSDANWENALQAWNAVEAFVFINIDKNNVLVNKARVLIELYRDDEAMQILEKIDTPSLQKNKNRLISIIKAQEDGDKDSEESLKQLEKASVKEEVKAELEK